VFLVVSMQTRATLIKAKAALKTAWGQESFPTGAVRDLTIIALTSARVTSRTIRAWYNWCRLLCSEVCVFSSQSMLLLCARP
jgi:hypothetical protein